MLRGPVLNVWNDTAALFHDRPSPSPIKDILLVIDSGYSHTTITPLLRGRPIHSAIRRIDIGGKHLTHYLAELISLRHFSLVDEPHIVNQIKEDACFVSEDFRKDLEAAWKGNRRKSDGRSKSRDDLVVDYVLPDYETLFRGHVRPHDSSHAAKMARLGLSGLVAPTSTSMPGPAKDRKEEAFPLSNERFVVPELLFTPSDVGRQECGIPETVMQSLEAVPKALWQGLLGNVLLIGGNTLFSGFTERVEAGIRMLAPAQIMVRVKRANE